MNNNNIYIQNSFITNIAALESAIFPHYEKLYVLIMAQ